MSILPVDSQGDRIKTDILTAGYLRKEIEDKHKILIPPEIKRLCFDYWFIDICDEWDETLYRNPKIEINGQIIKAIGDGYSSILGSHRVSSGQFEWTLKLVQPGVCVGIIKDLDSYDTISQDLDFVNYDLHGHGAFWDVEGVTFFDESNSMPKFLNEFKEKIIDNLIIGMKIDFDSQSLYYSVGKSEYIKAPYSLEKDESYRLVVSFFKESGYQVELL